MLEKFKKLFCRECRKERWCKGVHAFYCVICESWIDEEPKTIIEIERFVG